MKGISFQNLKTLTV